MWGEAMALLGSMASDRIDRNTITYTAVIACGGKVCSARALVQQHGEKQDRQDRMLEYKIRLK